MGNPVTVRRTSGIAASALLAFALFGAAMPATAQFAGGGGSTGIALEVADWVPARDANYGGWGVVPAGAPFDKPLQFTRDAPSLNLDAGTYDVYWIQDYDGRNRPILVAAGVKVDDGLVTVKADTGVKLAVASFVPPRDSDYGWWGAVKVGGEPGKPVATTKTADALLLSPGDYDIYWVQDYDARGRPLLLAAGVRIEAGKLAAVKADSGVRIEVASWVPARDADYGWWGAVNAGSKPDKLINATKAADALLLPPGDYEVYWVQDYDNRDKAIMLARLTVAAGKVETVNADSGVKLEVAPYIPARNADYGWWGAVKAGNEPKNLVNWTKTAGALLLPPGDYDVYWVQDYDTRDIPIRLASKLAIAAGSLETVKADSGIKLEVAEWVPARDPEYGWWGAVNTGADPKDLVNWSKTADALLLPPGYYDVYWVQNYATRGRPVLVEREVRASAPFGGVGLQLQVAGDALEVVQVIAGTPGERAGIKAGDLVVSVDGVPVKGRALGDVVEQIRGATTGAVKLGVQRGGASVAEMSVERAVIAGLAVAKVATGLRPVVAADVPPLDDDGYWGVAPAWEGPRDLAGHAVGKADPLVIESGLYDVFWRPKGSGDVFLKARNVAVRFGELSDVPIGAANLVPKPSVVVGFQLTADGKKLEGAGFVQGVKQIVARYEWKKAAVGYRLGVHWYKDGAKILEQGEPVATAEGETEWILKTADGSALPLGNYRVELIEEGDLRYPADFRIVEKLADLGPVTPPPAETMTTPPAETKTVDVPKSGAGEMGGTGGEWVLLQAVMAGGDPTISDDFSDPKSGWNSLDEAARDAGYADGAYRIVIDGTGQGWVFGSRDVPIGDGVLVVDATDTAGSAGHPFGIFVRGQDPTSFHAFVIGADESYAAFHVDKGAFAMDGAPDKRLPAGVYRHDGANHIAVFLVGDRIVYFLNNREIDRAKALWPVGAAGVVSANVRPGKTTVNFDDWKVWAATGTAGAN